MLLQSAFEKTRMYHQPDAMGLMVAQVPAPDMSCQLEFSITGIMGAQGVGVNFWEGGSLCVYGRPGGGVPFAGFERTQV